MEHNLNLLCFFDMENCMCHKLCVECLCVAAVDFEFGIFEFGFLFFFCLIYQWACQLF